MIAVLTFEVFAQYYEIAVRCCSFSFSHTASNGSMENGEPSSEKRLGL
jgi:hypothetical protein